MSVSGCALYVATVFAFFIIFLLTLVTCRWTKTGKSFNDRFQKVLDALHRFLGWTCSRLWSTPRRNWRIDEHRIASEQATDLDFHTATTAYETTMDKAYLDVASA